MRLLTYGASLGVLCLALPAAAATHTIYVAPRDTPAAAAAQGKANGSTVFAERTLQRGLDLAGELAGKPGAHEVNVLVAAGPHETRTGAGAWTVPAINNPAASLRIAGGYASDWGSRTPLETPSQLVTVAGRGGSILSFTRGTRLKQIVVSGLAMDASPSNAYDEKSKGILKGQSRTYPLLAFGLAQTDHLIVADNVFLNGAHGAFEPYVTPASANTVVDIQNNFFVNNIKTLMIGPNNPAGRVPIKEVNLKHNTFVLNWPYNPDPTSSNVGAVELYHRNSAATLNIEGNLFAYNPGGAFQHDWPENRMPAINFRRNLFFTNALLFGNKEPAAGPIVGKFGPNPKHMVLTLAAVEDDLKYKFEGNVSIDPQIKVAFSLAVKPGEGDDVAVEGYAPKVDYDPKALPYPTNPMARGFGVQPGQSLGIK
jgi:hypothetical protein